MTDQTFLQNIIVAIVSYVMGFITCLLLKKNLPKDIEGKIYFKENTFVLAIVSLIWALSVIIDIWSPQYETSPFIHGLMGAIVGFFYKPMGGKKE